MCSHRCLSDAIGAADAPPILSEVPRPINLPRAASARHAENRPPRGTEAAVADAAAALLAALADLCPHKKICEGVRIVAPTSRAAIAAVGRPGGMAGGK